MDKIEQLDEQLNTLDPFIRATILGIGVEEIIEHVAKDYSLTPEQIDQLVTEIYFYLTGVTDRDDFVIAINELIELDEEAEEQFFKDLNEHIFAPIRTEIRRYYEEKEFEQEFQQEEETAQEVETTSNLQENEKQTLKDAGVEMVESENEAESELKADRDTLLNQVENPQKAQTTSWQKKKTEEKQHIKSEQNDYSVEATKERKDKDPYREPIPEDEQ